MKAIVRHKYGSPDVLGLEEVPTPTPADDEVLIKVHATSINASDWELLTGSPLYIRLLGFGFLRPKFKILGSDIAGRIEANLPSLCHWYSWYHRHGLPTTKESSVTNTTNTTHKAPTIDLAVGAFFVP